MFRFPSGRRGSGMQNPSGSNNSKVEEYTSAAVIPIKLFCHFSSLIMIKRFKKNLILIKEEWGNILSGSSAIVRCNRNY